MNIPEVSIKRLCEISRLLERLAEAGREIIFSDEIGEKTGIPAYQVRKDISYLGEIGTPGRGYNVQDLLDHINNSLKLEEKRKTVLVGVGRLGSALLNYINLPKANCEYVAAFDANPDKIGTTENGVPILDIKDIQTYVKDNEIEVGVVTVPMDVAQDVVDTLVEGGVTGILNFAPVVIRIPDGVVKRCIDFSLEMKVLAAVKSLDPGKEEKEEADK